MTKEQQQDLFVSGVVVGLLTAAALVWWSSRPPKRVSVVYFYPDGSTGDLPFVQSPAEA